MDILKIKLFLRKEKKVKIRIMSGSMVPVLAVDGEYEINHIADNFQPKRFQIFVFWNGKILIAHYFWEKFVDHFTDGEEYWVFRGIANSTEDFPVKREDIIGYLPLEIPRHIRIKIILKEIFYKFRSKS